MFFKLGSFTSELIQDMNSKDGIEKYFLIHGEKELEDIDYYLSSGNIYRNPV